MKLDMLEFILNSNYVFMYGDEEFYCRYISLS